MPDELCRAVPLLLEADTVTNPPDARPAGHAHDVPGDTGTWLTLWNGIQAPIGVGQRILLQWTPSCSNSCWGGKQQAVDQYAERHRPARHLASHQAKFLLSQSFLLWTKSVDAGLLKSVAAGLNPVYCCVHEFKTTKLYDADNRIHCNEGQLVICTSPPSPCRMRDTRRCAGCCIG